MSVPTTTKSDTTSVASGYSKDPGSGPQWVALVATTRVLTAHALRRQQDQRETTASPGNSEFFARAPPPPRLQQGD